MGAGRPTVLSVDEENELSESLRLLARWGFGFTPEETKEIQAVYILYFS